MVAYAYRMPAGIAGDISRFQTLGTTIEVQEIDASDPPTAYGLACVLDATAHAIRPANTGDVTADIYGFNVRPFPTSQINTTDWLGNATPPVSGATDILKRGYMTVILRGTTAAVKGGQVYVWAGTTSGSHVRGGVEALAGGSNVTIPAYFTGPADAAGNVEIAFNI